MTKQNPFDKHLGLEDKLHIACFKYVALQYPKLLIHHSPNEGKRTPFEQYKIKQMGVKKGFPDFICLNSFTVIKTFEPELKDYKGLVVEFKAQYKAGNINPTTKEQKQWLKSLEEEGYCCKVITSFDEFRILIDQAYQNVKK